MEFVETSMFTDFVRNELTEDGNRELQAELIEKPTKGPVMRGSGGARKIRASGHGTGKSGGHRVIYYHAPAEDRCYMLIGFSKGEKANLTAAQTKQLREYIKRHLK